MRILVINWLDTKNPQAGGAEIYLFEIFSRIAAKEHHVTLFTSSFKDAPRREVIQGIDVLRSGRRNLFNFNVFFELKRILHEGNYDVVIDDINKIPFYSPSWVALPTMGLVMHLFRKSIFKEVVLPLGAYVYLAESLIPLGYRKTNFAVLSESSKKDVIDLGVPEEKIWVIPPCVDLSRYTPAPEAPRGRAMIIHVGRVKRYKSVDHLLYAADILKRKGLDFEVAVVGSGDDLPRLRRISEKLALHDCVRFLGWIPEAEKVDLYRKATIAVENSVKEGWGIIVIEANACGVPAIAARSPGLVDSVVDEETGLLYEYGNVVELAGKIESLLRDRSRRDRMAEKAVAWARKFSWDDAADRMLSLIKLTIKQY